MTTLLAKLKPKRRWVQVSLRSVLVFVTLLCVVLSLWVVPAERQRRAVAAIEALGGKVGYMDTPVASESFLRRWLPQAYFDEVEYIHLANTQVTDDGLADLQSLTSLQRLYLGTEVTDAGLVHLQGLTALQELWLNGTGVTDAGLAHLQGLTHLQWLNLADTHVTDAGLSAPSPSAKKYAFGSVKRRRATGSSRLRATTSMRWNRLRRARDRRALRKATRRLNKPGSSPDVPPSFRWLSQAVERPIAAAHGPNNVDRKHSQRLPRRGQLAPCSIHWQIRFN